MLSFLCFFGQAYVVPALERPKLNPNYIFSKRWSVIGIRARF